MIKNGSKPPLRIALYGMDARSSKNMEMYLKGPCQGIAVVVGEKEADIDMIDADFYKAREILEARKASAPGRPIILLSIQNIQINNTFSIKKPITVAQLEGVLARIQAITASRKSLAAAVKISAAMPQKPDGIFAHAADTRSPEKSGNDVNGQSPSLEKIPDTYSNTHEQNKATKHQTAIELNEGGFTAFLGNLADIDFNDQKQVLIAGFDRKQFFLGFVLSACQTAIQQSRALKLKSIWKHLLLFPDIREIWLDADDKQLRAFAGIKMNQGFASSLKLMAVDASKTKAELPLEKFQDMEAFLWKLTIWTSKGRFPIDLDIKKPVVLKRWPNFTRLVITPDALRIAALLVQGPIAPLDIISRLNSKPQYVFVFISACHALGWLEQYERPSKHAKVEQPLETKKPKLGLLSKILNKLRGA